MAALALLEGIRRNTQVYHAEDGYSYHKNKTMQGGRVSMRCILYHTRGCKARISAREDMTMVRQGNFRHNHDPNWMIIHERRFRNAVLNECRLRENSTLTLKEIYHKVRRNMRLPAAALVNISFKKLRPSMHAARNEILPNIPHSFAELVNILENPQYEFLTQTIDGLDNIYLGKFGQSALGTRVVVFASRRALRYLERNLEQCQVFCDGTFSSRPQSLLHCCAQVWSLLILRRNHVVVCIRALMQTKSQPCYETLLRAIRQAAPRFNPRTVMADFELSQAAAWEVVFPAVTVLGCFFHSSKAIALKASIIGLTILIRDNEEVDSIVRSLCALALLPPDRIVNGLLSVTQRCIALGYWDQLSDMFIYMRDTWTTPARLRLLSVHGCPHRTNNACESANSTLVSALRVKHPNIYSFLHVLTELEDTTEFEWGLLEQGINPSGPRRTSVLANDEAIRGFEEDLQQGFIDEGMFLARASLRIQNVYNLILDL